MRVTDEEFGAVKAETSCGLPRRQGNASGVPAQIGSVHASAAFALPVVILGSHSPRCSFVPASAIAAPPSKTVERNGPGITARPISSISTTRSTTPSPLPPTSSGMIPEPTLPSELLPKLVGNSARLGHPLPHELRIALALQEPTRAVAQQLLFLGKANIHGSALS